MNRWSTENNLMYKVMYVLTCILALFEFIPIIVFTADVVYMRQTSVRLRLPNNATVGDRVFDMNSLMVVDRENFDKFNLSFAAVSSHFKFNIQWV